VHWVADINEWSNWMRAGDAGQGTINKRRYQVGRLAQDNLHRSPWSLELADIAGWLSGWEWGTETRRAYRAAIRSFYRWGYLTGRVKANPTDHLPSIKPKRALPRPTPVDVVDQVLARDMSDRDRLIVRFEVYSGMRRSEVARARLDWVSDGEFWITGKGGKVRRVPIHDELRADIDDELARRRAGGHGTGWRYDGGGWDTYWFPGRNGTPMHPDALGKLVSQLLGHGWAGHSLRHRFLTDALAGSKDIRAVQELAGHASLATTQIYTHVTGDRLAAAVAAVRRTR
jgi:integrase/recombinase XerC